MSAQLLSPFYATEYRALMLEADELHPGAFTSSLSERAALALAWWETRLSSEAGCSEVVLGVIHQGVLAGAVGLSFESREKARHKATLFRMYVRSRFRRCGFGKQLMQAAMALLIERPAVKLVQLTVTQGNWAAQALYERSGFLVSGVEPFAVAAGHRYVSKVHMWRNIALPLDEHLTLPSSGQLEPAAHIER